MPNISIIADKDLIDTLMSDGDLPLKERKCLSGTVAESERLGFELGSIMTLVGSVVAGIEALLLARSLYRAARESKNPKLELIFPTGRVTINLEGKSEEEVAELVRAALPFTR